ELLCDRRDRGVGGLAQRVAIDARRDPGERDRREAVLACDRHRLAVTRRQLAALAALAAAIDRADRVDHEARLEPVAARQLRIAGLAAAERAALREQLLAGRAVDRAVDPTAAQQAGVRRVDDRVDVEGGDVGFHDRDPALHIHIVHDTLSSWTWRA